MKKVMMTKYGFERWPEQDFSDDGNRFTCYRVGNRVRVSKHTYNGRAYISARIDGCVLPYEVYSKLPHYCFLDDLNGVSLTTLTDAHLSKLFDTCVAYEQEYEQAEQNIKLPTISEIEAQCKHICAKYDLEINNITYMSQKNIAVLMTNLNSYQFSSIKDFYVKLVNSKNNYDVNTYPEKILGTARSIDFCKPNTYELEESFYYKQILELIRKALNKN